MAHNNHIDTTILPSMEWSGSNPSEDILNMDSVTQPFLHTLPEVDMVHEQDTSIPPQASDFSMGAVTSDNKENIPPVTVVGFDKCSQYYYKNNQLNNTCINTNKNLTWVRAPATFSPWVRAEHQLRQSNFARTNLRKVLTTRYDVPKSSEIKIYKVSVSDSLFSVRVNVSNRIPKKVSISSRGEKFEKIEFDVDFTKEVVNALTSIINGSKSKSVNLMSFNSGSCCGKLKFENVAGCLHITQTYPKEIKMFVSKNGLPNYLSKTDCQFTIPTFEVENLMNCLLDTQLFISFKREVLIQRELVLREAVKSLSHLREPCYKETYFPKLMDIAYSQDIKDETKKYPINVLLPELYEEYRQELDSLCYL